MKIPDYRISKLDDSKPFDPRNTFGKCGTLRVIEHMRYKVSTRPLILVLTFKFTRKGLRITKRWQRGNEDETK